MNEKLAFSISVLVVFLSVIWIIAFRKSGGEFLLVLASVFFSSVTILMIMANKYKKKR